MMSPGDAAHDGGTPPGAQATPFTSRFWIETAKLSLCCTATVVAALVLPAPSVAVKLRVFVALRASVTTALNRAVNGSATICAGLTAAAPEMAILAPYWALPPTVILPRLVGEAIGSTAGS